jgi:hypothetical protein
MAKKKERMSKYRRLWLNLYKNLENRLKKEPEKLRELNGVVALELVLTMMDYAQVVS